MRRTIEFAQAPGEMTVLFLRSSFRRYISAILRVHIARVYLRAQRSMSPKSQASASCRFVFSESGRFHILAKSMRTSRIEKER
jgi:hypothetical protein